MTPDLLATLAATIYQAHEGRMAFARCLDEAELLWRQAIERCQLRPSVTPDRARLAGVV